jgi:phosphate transport system protein
MSLKEHTVKSYDNDLKSIAGTLDLTVSLIFQSLDMISSAINQHNQQLVEDITNHDYKINTLDHLIEKKVTTILALRQPMAVDLRYITCSLKVSANLERIGDQAKNIIKKISLLENYHFDSKVQEWLTQMISISKNMIQNAVLAFNSQNLDLAQQVMTQDDIIDQTYRNFFSLLNKENFSRNEVNQIINTLFIAKSFERLADHSTNIAEITGFVITGETK